MTPAEVAVRLHRDRQFDLMSRIDEAVEDALQAGITKDVVADNVAEYLLSWEEP